MLSPAKDESGYGGHAQTAATLQCARRFDQKAFWEGGEPGRDPGVQVSRVSLLVLMI